MSNTTITTARNSFIDAMDLASGQTFTENDAPAVNKIGATHAQAQNGLMAGIKASITNASSTDTGRRGKGKTGGKDEFTVNEFIEDVISKIENLSDPDQLKEAYQLIFAYLANLRDVRGGKGERDLAYWVLLAIWDTVPNELTKQTMMREITEMVVVEYGSWGDAVRLWEMTQKADLKNFFRDLMITQLLVDETELKDPSVDGKPKVSLLAKHIASEGKKYDALSWELAKELLLRKTPPERRASQMNALATKQGAKKYAKMQYRDLVSQLRSTIKVVEKYMCDGSWDEINPSSVPGGAVAKYKNAFQNKKKNGTERSDDPKRIACAENFTEAATKSIDTGKGIHGVTASLVGMIKHYLYGSRTCAGSETDLLIEAQWADKVRELKESGTLPACLALADVSGSMSGTPMEVCIALALLVADIAPEAWRNRILTFETTPQWVSGLEDGMNLKEKVEILARAPWGGYTDFGKALNMILSFAKAARVPLEDMPKILFVFSDMQFNQADTTQSSYHGSYYYRDGAKSSTGFLHSHASIKRAFKEAGYECPHIVFWNLRGECSAQPCETISPDVSQMSGYSETMLKAFMAGDLLSVKGEPPKTPWDLVKAVLDSERYDPVRELVDKHLGARNHEPGAGSQ